MRSAPAFQLVTMPSRIEHIDRVVGDALDQQAELLLAAAQRLLGLPSLGEIAGDLGEAGQLAGVIADGVDDDMGPEAACRPCAPASLRLRTCLRWRRSAARAGQAGRAVLLGVEAGEVLADDLVRRCSP